MNLIRVPGCPVRVFRRSWGYTGPALSARHLAPAGLLLSPPSCRPGSQAGVEAVTDVESKQRQDITSASDADPLFGPVASGSLRYLASIAMTALATVVAVGAD